MVQVIENKDHPPDSIANFSTLRKTKKITTFAQPTTTVNATERTVNASETAAEKASRPPNLSRQSHTATTKI
ncbi:MAG: hypothetical protein WB680_00990 [Candidatus Acidiferrales bacterium]